MAIDHTRRKLLAAALLAAGASRPSVAALVNAPRPRRQPIAEVEAPTLLAAWHARRGDHAGTWSAARGAHGLVLPARSHGLLPDPLNAGQAIAVARRPGQYILRFNVQSPLRATIVREPEIDRVFEGHAAFSADGQTLYSSESDLDSGHGLIGVRDAATLAKRGEFATHGIGPHALLVDTDGSLLVANGGILTLPETGRSKRNIEQMDPSLVRLAAGDGQLLGQWRLPDSRLSIRHLARGESGVVGIALQAEHVEPQRRANASLFALFDGSALRLGNKRAEIDLGGYGGDIACLSTPEGAWFAVSCTRAGLIAWWDAADGSFTGVVPWHGGGALLRCGNAVVAAGEQGKLARVTPFDVALLGSAPASFHWDNHLALLSA
jgi:uncharacterized protein